MGYLKYHNWNLKEKNNLFALAALLFCFSILLYLSFRNEYAEGGADNYWHYFFSKYSYKYPKFFLHHWGKPIFIFLSAPFAQLGFEGIKLFNIFCAISSAFICFKLCKELNFEYSWLVIPITIFCPLYFVMAPTAMTEPLFSFLIILSSYLFFKGNFKWGSIIASFLLFSRTEGMFIIFIYAFFLTIKREWKFIPLLLTAFILYALIGVFSGKSFLWFFHEIPYDSTSPYGRGPFLLFFELYNTTFGLPLTILLLLGIVILFYNIIRKNEANIFSPHLKPNIKIFFLIFSPGFSFFMFHVIAWYLGKFGSAGVERVMASIIPCAAIIAMYAVNNLLKIFFNPKLKAGIAVLVLVMVVSFPFNLYSFPRKAFSDEKAERDAGEWFKKNRKEGYVLYYAHPAIVFYADLDPFDLNLNKECFAYHKDCNVEKDKPFYYFWDSMFSEYPCKTLPENLEECLNFEKVKEFKEYNFDLYVYEYTPPKPERNHYNGLIQEKAKVIAIQASNGKYLCTEPEVIVANRNKAKVWESFTIIMFSDGTCSLRSYNNLFLCAELNSNEIKAISKQIGLCETFRLHQIGSDFAFEAANGKFVTLDEETNQLFATSVTIGENEKFSLIGK